MPRFKRFEKFSTLKKFFFLERFLQLWCSLSMVRIAAGYQVEKRKPGGDWEKVNDFPIAGENATVSDLDEGKEYEFRVAAITGAGVGDYSLNTAPVKVCEKKGPIITQHNILSYTVIICQPSHLLVAGIPSPTHSFIPGLKPANPSHRIPSFFFFRIHYLDSPDCLLLFLSIPVSVFYCTPTCC